VWRNNHFEVQQASPDASLSAVIIQQDQYASVLEFLEE